MLRPIRGTVVLCSLARQAKSSTTIRSLDARRQFADNKSPDNGGRSRIISDFIAAQTSPSSPDIPPNRMPSQTKEDIGTEQILNGKGDGESKKISPDKESVNYEERVSPNEDRPGSPSASQTATVGQGRTVDKTDHPPTLQTTMTQDQMTTSATKPTETNEPIKSSGKSILDLFHERTTVHDQLPQASAADTPRNTNPLSSHGLDSNTINQLDLANDLSAWAEAAGAYPDVPKTDVNPNEWATSQRGSWDREPVPDPLSEEDLEPEELTPRQLRARALRNLPTVKELQERFVSIPPPKRKKRIVPPYDLQLETTEDMVPSPWDYFYPPPRKPVSLSEALRSDYLRRNPETRSSKEDVYDPFASKKKTPKWPFMYNRDQFIDKVTNYIMRDGQKALAEKLLQQTFLKLIEYYPRRHPATLLAEAVDLNAPILRNRFVSPKGSRKVMVIPVPLKGKHRIRIGFLTMLNASKKKRKGGSRGGGPSEKTSERGPFAERLAKEVVKVMEGRGSGLQFRLTEHKRAMVHRLNVKVPKTKVI